MATASRALREAQAPLKSQYKTSPSSALVTLSKSGTLDPSSLTCSLSSSAAARRIAGLHHAAGGPTPDMSSELCSGDMLLESLVACFGVTIRAVGSSMGIGLRGGNVTAEGVLDFRGTLGVKDSEGNAVEVGFQSIKLRVELELENQEGDAGKVEKLMGLSERYCVVLQTLRKGVGVGVETNLGHGEKSGRDDKVGGTVQTEKDKGQEGGSTEPTLNDEEVLQLN